MLTPDQARAGLKALQRAVELLGSSTALAAALADHCKNPRICQAHVWNWLNRDKKVPPDMAVPIEIVTIAPALKAKKEPVRRSELRPDIFTPEPRARRFTRTATA